MRIINQIFELALFRKRVSDIEYSPPVTALLVATWIGTNVVKMSQVIPSLSNPLWYSLVLIIGQLLGLYLILLLNKKSNRFVQTTAALAGVNTILHAAEFLSLIISFLALFHILFLIWFVVLQVKILKETLECNIASSVLALIAIVFISSILIAIISPNSVMEIFQHLEQLSQAHQNGK